MLFHPLLENTCNIPGKLIANMEMLAHFLIVSVPRTQMSSWRLLWRGLWAQRWGRLSVAEVAVKFSAPPEKNQGNTIMPLKSSIKSEGFIYIYIIQLPLEKCLSQAVAQPLRRFPPAADPKSVQHQAWRCSFHLPHSATVKPSFIQLLQTSPWDFRRTQLLPLRRQAPILPGLILFTST